SPNPLPITANATLPVNAGTPAVQNAYVLGAASTSTATIIPNNYSGATPVLNHLSMGYDNTASSNAYRAIHVDASGNQMVAAAVTVPVSAATLGVSVQNTPAIQG